MTFNSYIFILCFLPLTVILYYLANRISITYGKIVLITAGVVFYAYAGFDMLLLFSVSILLNYLFAKIVKRIKKTCGWIALFPIAVNIVLLLFFKYTGFIIGSFNFAFGSYFPDPDIILPLGISFYTFQQIAYMVSVSQGKITNACLIDYLCYILYFPKLLMGPLMEPVDFIRQINDPERKSINFDNLACGAKLFSIGLVKKVLLADTFAGASDHILGSLDTASSFHCILLVLVYSFDIYFDFSAYSDMATGVSSMLNIDLPINFNSPYKALSIRDFWKRWHISLTRFLTEYIFIPLGGSRKGIAFTYINTMIVFLISGMWHGANWTFILWGLLHGLFCCLDRALEKIEVKIFRHLFNSEHVVASILYQFYITMDSDHTEDILIPSYFLRSCWGVYGFNAGDDKVMHGYYAFELPVPESKWRSVDNYGNYCLHNMSYSGKCLQ